MKEVQGKKLLVMSEEEKRYLLKLARHTLEKYFNLPTEELPDLKTPNLEKPLGVFVTLMKEGELRGCIGYPEPVKPLKEAVVDMAISAAVNDPRFFPVEPREVSELEIEISVLSPLKKIQSIEEIEVGKHGLVIQRGNQRGLLLPQVASEHHWDRETFLSHTCMKAGLPADAWQWDDVEIYIFSAEVFSEKDFAKEVKNS